MVKIRADQQSAHLKRLVTLHQAQCSGLLEHRLHLDGQGFYVDSHVCTENCGAGAWVQRGKYGPSAKHDELVLVLPCLDPTHQAGPENESGEQLCLTCMEKDKVISRPIRWPGIGDTHAPA